ncbi:Eukaryotic DNA topoisomerase I, catalytic core [Sulfitobacter sp. THAF37]|uniref:DNA topoisomerase IB n=1 Tax=Sulfitobacter sp. THAF37 TaxID=2587855 RepID=UPI001268B381|nr:DNA topoisomerase IB [Sulfitobacter sp. THAF37]QFT58817.1 Eukaryotic DNA topoisomerase I, catalytic core [Sulfitobacter sp. THAF37]
MNAVTGKRLIYVSDDQPGISRRRRGRGFTYIAPDGTTIARGAERRRLEALAVPPAYEDVWMCTLANGHLQATGRDARKRKQYRYHPDWTEAQSLTKFAGLARFGHALPRLRRRVARDLEEQEGEHIFALACAVTLIDRTAMRVGDPAYTSENGSYGALTLRNRHVELDGDELRLRYRAKGGKKVRRTMTDRKLARILDRIGDLPGKELLSWTDKEGQAHSVGSADLNAYIADITGEEGMTAKTFRTWAGTLSAFKIAEKGGATIKAMSEAAADTLSNTPTIARNSYIHPEVIALAKGDPLEIEGLDKRDLYAAEGRLLRFLENG